MVSGKEGCVQHSNTFLQNRNIFRILVGSSTFKEYFVHFNIIKTEVESVFLFCFLQIKLCCVLLDFTTTSQYLFSHLSLQL